MTHPNPHHALVELTPETARQWLTRSVRNRPLSATTVARYRADMVAGRWLFAGDPIRFDVDGNLIDGQHRLHALATCPDDTLIEFMVITKLPTDSQMVMDQGRRRTTGDQLGLLGVKNGLVIGAAVRLIIARETGLLFKDVMAQQAEITTPRIEEWVRDNTELIEHAAGIKGWKIPTCPASVSFCAALLFVEHVGVDFSAEFFRLLNVGTAEGNPINALDRRLRRISKVRLRATQRELLALYIQAMNAWLDEKTITKFQKPRGAKWTADTFPKLRRIA